MKTLKKEWKGITDRVKNVSGLAAGEEPEWYQHINPILAETNEEINPTSSALQTAFVNRDESDSESGSEDEEGIEEHDDENENEGETTSSSTAAKKSTRQKTGCYSTPKTISNAFQQTNFI